MLYDVVCTGFAPGYWPDMDRKIGSEAPLLCSLDAFCTR